MRSDAAAAWPRLSGFTIIELIVVVVLLGILSAFAIFRTMPRAGESTAGYQAQQLANDLRHAQMLAMAWGKDLTFTAASGFYVVCSSIGKGVPCPDTASAVTDPGRGGPFAVTLEGASVSSATVTFDIVGKPSSAAGFTLTTNGTSVATVAVAANTGFVTLQ